MPLNLPNSRATTAVAFLRYSARDGLWSTRDSLIDLRSAVWDLGGTRTGWLAFQPGEAPDLAWDVNGKAVKRPSRAHRRGFSLRLAIEDEAYEFTSTGAGVISAVIKLYDQYEKSPESARGLLPVVQCSDPVAVETTFGPVLDPVFEIIDWVRRPAVLPHNPPTGGASVPAVRAASDLDDTIPF
jgi:hypothetical protein